MDLPGRFVFLCTIAAGAFAVAVLTLLGALWPDAPTDKGRAELAFALTFAGIAFFSEIMLLVAKLSAERIGHLKWLERSLDAAAATVFVAGFFGAGVKINLALNTWFDPDPIMGPGDIVFLRSLLFGPFLLLVGTGVLVIFLSLRRRTHRR